MKHQKASMQSILGYNCVRLYGSIVAGGRLQTEARSEVSPKLQTIFRPLAVQPALPPSQINRTRPNEEERQAAGPAGRSEGHVPMEGKRVHGAAQGERVRQSIHYYSYRDRPC